MHVGINRQPAGMTGDFGGARDFWRQCGAFDVHLRCAATIAVIHCFRGAFNYGYAIGWYLACVAVLVVWFLCLSAVVLV